TNYTCRRMNTRHNSCDVKGCPYQESKICSRKRCSPACWRIQRVNRALVGYQPHSKANKVIRASKQAINGKGGSGHSVVPSGRNHSLDLLPAFGNFILVVDFGCYCPVARNFIDDAFTTAAQCCAERYLAPTLSA